MFDGAECVTLMNGALLLMALYGMHADKAFLDGDFFFGAHCR